MVETNETSFFEGAWGGDFQSGRLDANEIVFGTGAMLDGQSITFISSLATTDYLYYRSADDVITIANSLALLLAALGDSLDPHYQRYADVNYSIVQGWRRYERLIPTRQGHVSRLSHVNLRVHATGATEQPKPDSPDFATFAEYRAYLDASYAALVANARDAARRQPLRIFSTQSRGYDTTAINAVAAPHGVDAVFTVRTGKGGGSMADNPLELEVNDDGTDVAASMGLTNVIAIERRAFAKEFHDELYYHASISECQDANLKQIAGRIVAPALLLTGTLGELWYTDSAGRPGFISDDLMRYDLGGHGLTEIRLRAGYVQAALPYLGARRRARILAITESDDMKPWRLGTSYDRPIPRRLGETAGVPRDAFGQVKIGSVVEFAVPQVPQDSALRARFFEYLRHEGVLRGWQVRALERVRRINERFWFANPTRYPLHYYARRVASRVLRREVAPIIWNDLRGSLFCFAVNEVVREYASTLRKVTFRPTPSPTHV